MPLPAGDASLSSDQRVIKKVSRHLLGFLFLLFVVSFLDRINFGFAGLTMMKDLGLASTTGLIYASVLLVVGCAVALILPIPPSPRAPKSAT